MGTYILDKKKIARLKLNTSEYNVLIRITNPTSKFPDLDNENIFRDILYLQFFDLEDESTGLYLFNATHLAKILDFFEKHKNCRNMVIHCDEGKSRSAGVAVGWFFFTDSKSNIYQLYHDRVHSPNRRVAEHFFRHFKMNLKYLDKWEKEMLEGMDGTKD